MMFSPFFTDFNAKAVEIPMILDRIGVKMFLSLHSPDDKIEKFPLFCFFSETWRHLGIAQTNLALLSVCTSFPH